MNTRAVPTQLDNWVDGMRVFIVLVEDTCERFGGLQTPSWKCI